MMKTCIDAEKHSVTIQLNMKKMAAAAERKVQSERRGNVERIPALEVLPGDNVIANRLFAK